MLLKWLVRPQVRAFSCLFCCTETHDGADEKPVQGIFDQFVAEVWCHHSYSTVEGRQSTCGMHHCRIWYACVVFSKNLNGSYCNSFMRNWLLSSTSSFRFYLTGITSVGLIQVMLSRLIENLWRRFLQAECFSCCKASSIKALKGTYFHYLIKMFYYCGSIHCSMRSARSKWY